MTTICYPFRIAPSGRVDTCGDPRESAKSRATFLLSTVSGERVMRPGWGVDALEMFYVLEDEHAAVREAVLQALATHVPEMLNVRVAVRKAPEGSATALLVEVRYQIAGEMEEDVLMIDTDGVG